MRKLSEVQKEFENAQKQEKDRIRQEPKRSKRFWKFVLYYLVFPFKWCWVNFRDWRTFLIFIIVMLVVGVEVWLPLLLGLILNNAWLLGIAGTCEAFWLAPFTPFLPLCIVITITIKEFINKKFAKNKTDI